MLWMGGTFVLRLGEAVIALVPDLLVGVLIAGLLRHLVGDERLRGWFGSPWKTALAAIALPVGAAGILPVAVVLHRAGASVAAVVTTFLVGGAIGPLSMAYLLERATPSATLVLVVMLIAMAITLYLLLPKTAGEPAGDDAPGMLPALAEAKPLLKTVTLPLLIGIVVFAATAAFFPPSFVGEAMHNPAPLHLVAALVMPIIGVYPPTITSLFSGEAAAGVYPGAAWTMLTGGGLTIASFVLLFKLAGGKTAATVTGLLLAAILVGFFALHLTPRLVTLAAEDSHAFDRLSRPFHLLDGDAGPVASILSSWADTATAVCILSGIFLLILAFAPMPRVGHERSAFASAGAIMAIAAVGIAVWAIGTLYVYFPSAPVVLSQMRHAEGDLSAALGTNDADAAHATLDHINRLAARGRVGSYIRFDPSSADELDKISQAVNAVQPEITGDLTYALAADVFRAASAAR